MRSECYAPSSLHRLSVAYAGPRFVSIHYGRSPRCEHPKTTARCAYPSVEHTTCDTGDDSSEAFLVRWRSGECGRYLVRIF